MNAIFKMANFLWNAYPEDLQEILKILQRYKRKYNTSLEEYEEDSEGWNFEVAESVIYPYQYDPIALPGYAITVVRDPTEAFTCSWLDGLRFLRIRRMSKKTKEFFEILEEIVKDVDELLKMRCEGYTSAYITDIEEAIEEMLQVVTGMIKDEKFRSKFEEFFQVNDI